jgi:hypothetical protein
MWVGAEDVMMRTLDQPWAIKGLLVVVAAAPVSLALGLGSEEDPLGYTVVAQKPEALP